MALPTDPLVWAVKSFQDGRNATINVYEDYLNGRQPVAFATQKFRQTFGRLFDSFAYNRLSSVVEAHADRLQVAGLGADDKTLGARAQAQWDANRMDVRENESTNDALAFGDGFVIVEKHPETGVVHYWINDPREVRVHYSDEVPGQLDLAAKMWLTEDGYARLNLYYVDRIDKYISRQKATGMMPQAAQAFEYLEDESFALEITDTVPVFHLANAGRTNRYGLSEIRLLIPLQDAINYVLMSGMVAAEFAAFSQKVIMGVDAEDEQEREQIQKFVAGVDRVMALAAPDAKIGEFSAANINQYIDLAEFWDETVSRVSRVPVHYLKMSAAPESGEAKRLNEAPFTAKIIDKQRSFGYGYGEVVRYGLRLDGMPAIPPGAIRINWESAAPHSEQDTWELVRLMQSANLPLKTALRIGGGFDAEQIETILQEIDEEREARIRQFNAGVVDAMPFTGGGE